MVEELLNITLGEVGGKSEAQTDTNSELRRRQMDAPGKNGLAKIFGASYGAGGVALTQHHQEFLTAVAANHVVERAEVRSLRETSRRTSSPAA